MLHLPRRGRGSRRLLECRSQVSTDPVGQFFPADKDKFHITSLVIQTLVLAWLLS